MRTWLVLMGLAACDVPGTNVSADAGTQVDYSLSLMSRYADPDSALEGLELVVDGKSVPRSGEVVRESFPSMQEAAATSTEIEVRYSGVVLDRVIHSPGEICIAERGNGNRLQVESVNLCVRANGELQLNDFSCEYAQTGYFTADVFCPTDCHPILGARSCGEDRCGLVLTHSRPRFGRLECVPIGDLDLGDACEVPEPGHTDNCGAGLACVLGACRAFCLDEFECSGNDRCVSALRGVAEPMVCLGELEFESLDTAQLP